MRVLVAFSTLLLAGITATAPAKSGHDERVIVTKGFFPESFVKYRSKHDIVSILVPLNALNFDVNEFSDFDEDTDPTLFFVEADIDADGKRAYKGLYVLKDGKATKLLENGRAAAASGTNSKQVFFAAQDGIYEYKMDTNEAVKYGSVTDSIIDIAKTNATDVIYILTDNHELYKVTDAGNTKTKVNEVVDAKEIVLDYSDNLYFYAQDKMPYVLTADGVKSIEGLTTNPSKVKLIKPTIIIKDGVPFIVDNTAYIIYANGSSVDSGFEFKAKAKPTAYAMEATLIQFYAYNKKIYEYNILAMVLGDMVIEEFKSFLGDKTSAIQSLASQRRGKKNKI